MLHFSEKSLKTPHLDSSGSFCLKFGKVLSVFPCEEPHNIFHEGCSVRFLNFTVLLYEPKVKSLSSMPHGVLRLAVFKMTQHK